MTPRKKGRWLLFERMANARSHVPPLFPNKSVGPHSRSFFARYGIPLVLTLGHRVIRVKSIVFGHLGKTSEIWGSFVREQRPHQKMQLRLSSGAIEDP